MRELEQSFDTKRCAAVGELLQRPRLVAPSQSMTRHRERVGIGVAVSSEDSGEMRQQARETHEIPAIVFQYARHVVHSPKSHELGPDHWHEVTTEVILAYEPEQSLLGGLQPAVRPAGGEGGPGRVQQVEVSLRLQRRREAHEPIARCEQWHVEALAVEGHEVVLASSSHFPAWSSIAASPLNPVRKYCRTRKPSGSACEPEHERQRTGAARESGGLGVEEEKIPRAHRLAIVQNIERRFEEPGNLLVAVERSQERRSARRR